MARPCHDLTILMTTDPHSRGRWPVAIYLLLLLTLTIGMVSIGGITRHTDSGLSITDWRLVAKVMPPDTVAEWQELFQRYQNSPEYRLQNSHMHLADFQKIYWWEWTHRQAGRVIGVIWLLGFGALALAGFMTLRRTLRILLLGTLGLSQGLIGWWMVQSGLAGDMVDVASTRLAVHLTMAFLIIGLIWWACLGELWPSSTLPPRSYPSTPLMGICLLGLFAQTGLGALVAGIDAGSAFPTWPLMNGAVIPDLDIADFGMLENPAFVHFWHRITGYCLALLIIVTAIRYHFAVLPVTLLAGATIAQILLGILTVVTVVETRIALLHQLLAVVMLIFVITCLYGRMGSVPKTRAAYD